MKDYPFFATVSRMKYIERWALMRNARTETLSEHTLDVAMIAHAIAVMQSGRIVESGPADRVLDTPAHPYTRKLLAASLDTP